MSDVTPQNVEAPKPLTITQKTALIQKELVKIDTYNSAISFSNQLKAYDSTTDLSTLPPDHKNKLISILLNDFKTELDTQLDTIVSENNDSIVASFAEITKVVNG